MCSSNLNDFMNKYLGYIKLFSIFYYDITLCLLHQRTLAKYTEYSVCIIVHHVIEICATNNSIQWPGVKCGYADVVTGNLRMLLRINLRKLPCITSAHLQNTHV